MIRNPMKMALVDKVEELLKLNAQFAEGLSEAKVEIQRVKPSELMISVKERPDLPKRYFVLKVVEPV